MSNTDKPDKAEKAEARKIKALQRKAKKLAKDGEKTEEEVLAELMAEAGLGDEPASGSAAAPTKAAGKENKADDDGEGRTVSAVLTSHKMSRDVHIDQFTLLFHGHELLMDAKLELNHGRCEICLYKHAAPLCCLVLAIPYNRSTWRLSLRKSTYQLPSLLYCAAFAFIPIRTSYSRACPLAHHY